MMTRLHSCGWLLALAACDAGTSTQGAELTTTRYEVRIADKQIGGNGHTKHELFAFGTNPDGTPATGDVVLTLDRASAGTLTKSTITLGSLGGTSYFTPCTHATAGCTGSATISMALASAPTVTVASVTFDVVVPTRVSTAAPCKQRGTYMYLDGNDSIRNGMLRVDDWATLYTEANTPTNLEEVRLSLSPAKVTQGNFWSIGVDTYEMTAPLAVGVYLDAQRSHFAAAGHPGLAVAGNGSGCNTVTGAFEIHELVVTSSGLSAVTISFEQHCEGGATMVEGCVRYEKP
jgi:hypothetical protein